jgi:glycosyltransferase involved in cell wall biosynthesis
MRIAFLAWRDLGHPRAGGSEILVDHLARGMAERGHEVALLCGAPVSDHPYTVVGIGGTYDQYLRAPLSYLARFRTWDLLVDVENGIPYFSPLWRRGALVCLVHHVHTQQWAQHFPTPIAALGQWTEERLMPVAYRRAAFIAVSASTAAALAGLGISPARIHRITNGVDVPARSVAKSRDPLFVTVSRLVPHKRVDLVLRAWEQVRARTGGRLVVVGDGPQRHALERLAGADVIFAGAVDDAEKWRLLSTSWLLIHGAQHEGWGLVVMEAAAVRTPALGFDVPGVRDAIVDGVTGALVDSEDALATRWVELAADHAGRRRLGTQARTRATSFSWDRTVDDFARIADHVVGSPSRRRTLH